MASGSLTETTFIFGGTDDKAQVRLLRGGGVELQNVPLGGDRVGELLRWLSGLALD